MVTINEVIAINADKIGKRKNIWQKFKTITSLGVPD